MARLTEFQALAASTFDRHLVVTAGAGAGKTRVLIARILGLLAEGHAELDQVVALTFTNKAAGEMKQRLREALAERARTEAQQSRSTTSGHVWERRLRDLDRARITTIHGFCGQLLREHPVEAGVDPQFAVVEEAEAGLWLHEALNQSVLARLDQGHEGLAQLLGPYPRLELLRSMAGVYGRVREYGADPEALAEETSRALDESRRLLPDQAVALEKAAGDLLAALREKAAGAGGKRDARAAEQAEELETRWQAARVAMERLATGQGAAIDTPALLRVVEAAGKVVSRRSRSLLAEVEALQAVIETIHAVAWGLLFEPAALAVGEVLADAHRLFQERKRRQGLLDFSDMQLLARDLLQQRSVAAELRDQFPYLMIDEYQDTNPLQAEIIRLWQPQNLFVVGDPKQSIYRFRGADVELFRAARREIPAAGGEEIRLAENFRSAEGLIHFVNHLFGQVMDGAYEEFLPGRGTLHTSSAAAGTASFAGPSVELLLPREMENEADGEKGGKGGAAKAAVGRRPARRDDLELEAEVVAERIARMVAVGQPLVGDPPGTPVRFGDIAILARATRVFSYYEQALRRRGIPYHVVSGRGFYARQEVQDCLNLLRALDNPADDLSLVGALRSPFFGLSDETLYWLAQSASGPWRRRLSGPQPEQVRGTQAQMVQRAATLLSRFGLLKNRVPLPDLLEQVIEETEYGLVALAGRDGEQVVANLEKLVSLARRMGGQSAGQVRDFIGLVEEYESREVREGEAAVQAGDGNTVKLMSVHQSKGLEFPVVFVADLGHPPQGLKGILFRPGMGVGIDALSPDGDRRSTWLRRRLEEEEKRLEREEDMRVFYVAATRARDYLALAGTRAKINTARSYMEMSTWLEWVCRALNIVDTTSMEAQRAAGLADEYLSLPGPAGADGAPPRIRIYLPGEVEEWLAEDRSLPSGTEGQPSAGEGAPSAGEGVHPAGVPASLRDGTAFAAREEWVEGWPVTWSVTDLMTYDRCPRRFALQRLYGLKGSGGGTARSGPGPSLDAVTRGNLVHRVLERLRDPVELDSLVERTLREAGFLEEAGKRAAKEVRPLLDRYLTSEVFARIRIGQARSELPFHYRLGGSRFSVSGVIDSLVTAANQSLVIDFKTNQIRPEQVEATAEEYRLQVEVYALVAARLLGAPADEAWLYFLQPNVCYRRSIAELDLPAVEGRLAELAKAMTAGRSLADYPPEVANHCHSCPQRRFCRAAGVLSTLDGEAAPGASPETEEVSP